MFFSNELNDFNDRPVEAFLQKKKIEPIDPANPGKYEALKKIWDEIIPRMPGVIPAGSRLSIPRDDI